MRKTKLKLIKVKEVLNLLDLILTSDISQDLIILHFMTIENIPESFKSNDIIYHYCSMSTALEYILSTLNLQLSPREESTDPLESMEPFYRSGGIIPANELNNYNELLNETYKDISSVKKDLQTKNERLRQACFCKNDRLFFAEFALESYGFFKPRMWNQYANDFKGVCLAFSQKSILEEKGMNSKELIFGDDIHYKKSHHFSSRKKHLNPYEFKELGKQEFHKLHFDNLKKTWFEKHTDYKDENEYRICTLAKKRHDYICVEKSLKGLIFSKKHISDFSSSALVRFAEELEIHAISLVWNSHPVQIKTEHSPSDLYNEILNCK